MTPTRGLVALGAAWDELDVDQLVAVFADDGVVVDPLLPGRPTAAMTIRELYTAVDGRALGVQGDARERPGGW